MEHLAPDPGTGRTFVASFPSGKRVAGDAQLTRKLVAADPVREEVQGLPATQGELINEVQDWFAQNSPNGDIPEESTTRKKIAPIWRVLRERD